MRLIVFGSLFFTVSLLCQTITAKNDEIPEVFHSGDFTVYVASTVRSVRGVVVALGGPDTRAFISDVTFGTPTPELEASFKILGRDLRSLAVSHGLAVLGTRRAGLANAQESDNLILDAVREVSAMSGHPELASAPLFLYGMSGGGPEASGFTARNPRRVIGLFIKVAPVESQVAEVLAVPTYVVLAEFEKLMDNTTQLAKFKANRKAGALLALAVEPGVPHHSLTPHHRAITLNWMRAIVELRLGTAAGDPLRQVAESSGWLGDSVIGVAPWDTYPADRRSASWFPSKSTAEEWRTFVGKTDAR